MPTPAQLRADLKRRENRESVTFHVDRRVNPKAADKLVLLKAQEGFKNDFIGWVLNHE